MLNVDTKILSKAISNKLKAVLSTLNSSQQAAYVKNRFIGESGRLISDIIEISDLFHIEGFLETIDIEKAFDSLDHDFLSSVLKKFEFNKSFITRNFITSQLSWLINSGTTIQYFNIERGICQGDLIYAYLLLHPDVRSFISSC